jgi:TorA maturation chaperone TorD
MHKQQINQARIFLYDLFAMLFIEKHVQNDAEVIMQKIDIARQTPFDDGFESALSAVSKRLREGSQDMLYQSYHDLFLIPFDTHIPLSTSRYDEGREAGTMLVKVREILANTKIRRDESQFSAPEDHFGFIFALCSTLLEQSSQNEGYDKLFLRLFDNTVEPVIDDFIVALRRCGDANYQNVALALEAFINFERSYLKQS